MQYGYPVIPETITVHLGAPDENARNIEIPFIDYIKNVASSEIYPTWPKMPFGQYLCAGQLCIESYLYRMVSFQRL